MKRYDENFKVEAETRPEMKAKEKEHRNNYSEKTKSISYDDDYGISKDKMEIIKNVRKSY